jgi:hypothetical protein
MKFILSTEKVNSYGFRLLTSGVKLERFNNNPVMLYNHNLGAYHDKLPIGRWKDIGIEGANLVAHDDIDREDDFASEVGRKVDKGYLKAASVGFEILEMSSDPEDMVAGQTLPTVTSWAPFEASIVDIPSNDEALVLKYNGELIVLEGQKDIGKLNFLSDNSNSNSTPMKKFPITVLTLLALSADAEDVDVLAAVQKLKKDKEDAEQRAKDAEEKLSKSESKGAVDLVEAKAKELKLTEDEKNAYLSLVKSDPELCIKTLNMIGERKTLTDLAGGNGGGNGDAGKPDAKDGEITFDKLSKENPKELLRLKNEEPDEYKKLLNAQIAENKKTLNMRQDR